MTWVTHDRAPIIDFIGRQSGSPALKPDGAPTVLTGHESEGAKRVGWPEFFKAVGARHLAMRIGDDGAWSWVDRRHPHDAPAPGAH